MGIDSNQFLSTYPVRNSYSLSLAPQEGTVETPTGPTQIQLETVGGNMLEDLMHLTASLHPTPMRKLSACAKRGGRCHLSRPKGIGFRCIPQLVAPIRVGGVRPRDERSRRLDLSQPFFLANALSPPGCGIP